MSGISAWRAVLLAALAGGLFLAVAARGADRHQAGDDMQAAPRREMVERGLRFLVGIQRDGEVGESRPKAVTALFLLAALSSGVTPQDPVYGPALAAGYERILANSSQSFLGGEEEPNADHALVQLALIELVGTAASNAVNVALYAKAKAALQYSLDAQDDGVDPNYNGGWRPNDKTRTNDRLLSSWFLLGLHGGQLRDMKVPKGSTDRAQEFVVASQKGPEAEKVDERGGFSVGYAGLAVRSQTAAGLQVLALFDGDRAKTELARDWLVLHPPRWYGPHFYETDYFAVRGLYRMRDLDGGKAFKAYFKRSVRLLRERQEADGSFPLPPGHGGPLMAMGPGYSTALAILILNVDRGFLPLDQ